jgi:hypothetical protein
VFFLAVLFPGLPLGLDYFLRIDEVYNWELVEAFSVNSIACLLLGYYFIVDSIRCLVLGLAVLGKYKALRRVLVSRRFASSCIYRC